MMPMMNTIPAGKRALPVCLLLLLAVGCSREQQDWRLAETADSIEAYGRFIERHPDSELTTEARSRIAQLREEHDWDHAGSVDTAQVYQEFLAQHPSSRWAQEARIRIDNFSLGTQAQQPAGATGTGDSGTVLPSARATESPQPAGGVAPARGGPQPLVATTAVPQPAGGASADGSFAIQLGAFSSASAADNQWHALSSRFGPELDGLTEHVVQADTPAGRIYRLQATVGDQTRARAICEAFRKQAQACVPVLPR